MGVSSNRSTENENADSKVHTHVIIGDVPICHVFWHFSLLHIVTESSVFPSDNCFKFRKKVFFFFSTEKFCNFFSLLYVTRTNPQNQHCQKRKNGQRLNLSKPSKFWARTKLTSPLFLSKPPPPHPLLPQNPLPSLF